MVVPAGLVNNWHREINDVFHLGFEVFGSEGDVTDRKSNAFAKHDRLIASIDTLKRRARVRRLLEAPRWDLVVFDEAHHLTASRSGSKVRRTENYKLAEALRDHTRDLILLSATPAPGRPLPLLDAGATAESDAVHRPRGDDRQPAPPQHGGVPPHQGGCMHAGRRAALRPPLGAHRVVHHEERRTRLLRRVAGVSAGGLRPRENGAGTRAARSGS